MISPELANIDAIAIHKVGNKGTGEGITLSNSLIKTSDTINQLLLSYFFTPFKSNEYFNLHHDTDLQLNEIFNYVSGIFDNPDSLYEQSVNIAKHLYNQSIHPKVNEGELYVVYLQDCLVDGETVDAVGIFKSETRETYLKVYPKGDGFEINTEDGININKLDKGCLIFNTEAELGYLVAVAENLKKASEARYWKDDFLKLTPRTDEYFNTKYAIGMCKDFITEKLPDDFQVSRVDQADLLNKSAKFFKEKESFGLGEFAEEVIQQPEVMDAFQNYREEYEAKKEIPFEEDFQISKNAVKNQSRVFKSVIKLDKNFHIYVHGKREYIVKGHDEESGMNYYQIFFHEES